MNRIFQNIKNICMANITINETTVVGDNLSIIDGVVYIDGKRSASNDKIINIKIEGDLQSLRVDVCQTVDITGNVTGDINNTSGKIKCGEVGGDVKTMSGGIECLDVKGKVKTMSGNVTCNNVGGKVDTMSGNIRYNK